MKRRILSCELKKKSFVLPTHPIIYLNKLIISYLTFIQISCLESLLAQCDKQQITK